MAKFQDTFAKINNRAEYELRVGWWSISEIAGKYLCLIGDDNQQIGTGVKI